jgi:hypothetical protein
MEEAKMYTIITLIIIFLSLGVIRIIHQTKNRPALDTSRKLSNEPLGTKMGFYPSQATQRVIAFFLAFFFALLGIAIGYREVSVTLPICTVLGLVIFGYDLKTGFSHKTLWLFIVVFFFTLGYIPTLFFSIAQSLPK